MRSLKFCANLNFLFKEVDGILNRYDAAKSAGFTAVEIGFPYEIPISEIQRKKEETGLEQILINAYPGDLSSGDFGLAGVPGRETDFNNAVKLTLEYADALQCKKVHFMTGKLDPGSENSPVVLKTLEKNLTSILPDLQQRGIIGLIEPINNLTIPGYLLSDFDAALSVVKAVNSPNLQLQVDIFHLQHIHGNVTHRLQQLLPFTGHIQIAQVPFRNEPHLAGELNYSYIFDVLEKAKYTNWIGLEYNSDPVFQAGGQGTTIQGLSEWTTKLNCNIG
ncbi:putative hydroxypyruvate isomerase [Folsomia candida]|uniref:Putative hydroxypyruvate isomerase n=1 Tax=Folsomia candida TaxID=158441 RepID=A0A226E4X2_FOLCA|nr:putative hydroxypyruvate isomerase [Folsomia candida]OXA52338.1 putative hydroxypyruvate isomerase [Folsomia candida]